MVATLLLCWEFEILIVNVLALFVILPWSNLSTVLRFAVSVLEAPVAELEVAALGVCLLHVAMLTMVGRVVVVHAVQEVRWDARADTSAWVSDFTGASTTSVPAVLVNEALSVTENIVAMTFLIPTLMVK